ncbi:MAG: ribosome maturation factor RimM [Clostridiales bacterium]|jgi:16S rRNA processing protein RimM|nr:ribosome maturation factor RimM [Clostridiales bacterium]
MKVTIAKIAKPHGVKGELKVLPDTFDKTIFVKLKSVFIDGKAFPVEYAKIAGGYVILKLRGVDAMTAAESFRNKSVQIERAQRLKLPDGFHYISDLIGCGVYVGERRIGGLTAVLQNGAADVYVVDGGESEIMFPALENLLTRVDTDNKIIVLDEKRFGETAVINEKKQ